MTSKYPSSYLGTKGYTIFKSEISKSDEKMLKSDLTIVPYSPGAPKLSAAAKKEITYYIYKECVNKYYIPPYYGVTKFGPLTDIRIGDGDNIVNVKYIGKLRDYQQIAMDTYIEASSKHTLVGVGGGILELYTGYGKTKGAMYIIGTLLKKVLICVHKEDLATQWIIELQNDLPGIRIGMIQGSRVEIGDDYDVTVAMIQTLSSKEYPPNTFSGIGLLICDEVHHVSSKHFSKILSTCVVRRTLGLSATVQRKDGTANVFYNYLGPIIYSKRKRDISMNVTVLAITYKSNDPIFNADIYNSAGNICNANMIKKLCEFGPRNEFIIKVLKDSIERDPNQQHALYAHNTSAVDILHELAELEHIDSLGFYYKSMKPDKLEISKQKKVIFATIMKAGEGVNIKTLTTSMYVTPVTDVEQLAGRNQRQVNISPPIIFDFVDTHAKFQKQYSKRKSFYNSEDFTIYEISSDEYVPDFTTWHKCKPARKKKSINTKTINNDDIDNDIGNNICNNINSNDTIDDIYTNNVCSISLDD